MGGDAVETPGAGSAEGARGAEGLGERERNAAVPLQDGGRSEGPRQVHRPPAPLAQAIGRTRYVVLLAVAAVLLVAMALFVAGAATAVIGIWQALQATLRGELGTTDMTVRFLEIVSVMLKAVVFYIVGIGLYSLFIAPLNLTAALGVESLNDLENKIVSVIIVIMAITFVEHFIVWEQPAELLQFGVTLAVVVAALVLFQAYNSRAREEQKLHDPDTEVRAQRDLFQQAEEQRRVRPDEESGVRRTSGGDGRPTR